MSKLELITKIEKYDIDTVVKTIKGAIERCKQIKVSSRNYLYAENERKELTSILDTYTRVLSEGEEQYLLPYKNLVEPVLNAINELSSLESQLKKDILEQKKKAFREEVKVEFYNLCGIICTDGIIPDFDSIYDEKWYGKTQKTWRESLLKKINSEIHKEESFTAYIVIETTRSKIDEVKRFLTEQKLSFRLEEIKE